MDPSQLQIPPVVIDLLTHSPAAVAILFMLRHVTRFMTDQRDFFFGEDGYVTKRDKAMEAAINGLTQSQRELAQTQRDLTNRLQGMCKFRPNRLRGPA